MVMSIKSQEKIILLGNNWHGNFSHFLFLNMQEMGYNCEHINTRFERKSNKIINAIRYRVFVKRLNRDLVHRIAREKVKRVLVVSPYNILPGTWQLFREKKVSVNGWFGDNPNTKGIIFNTVPWCDRVFLIDAAWLEKIQHLNRSVEYLPHAADPDFFYPLDGSRPYTHDMVFIGDSFNGDRDGLLRASVLKTLFDHHINIKLFGDAGWKKLYPQFPFLKDIYLHKISSPEELNTLYNASKVVLNIHHSQLLSGTNQRTFEIAASRSFQLADYRQAVADMYQGSSITFTSTEDLVNKAAYYLAHDREREILAEKARTITLGSHTYKHRIEKLTRGWH